MEVIAKYGGAFFDTPADTIHRYVDSLREAIAHGRDPRTLPPLPPRSSSSYDLALARVRPVPRAVAAAGGAALVYVALRPGVASIAALLFVLYVLPVPRYRLHELAWPLRPDCPRSDTPAYSPWWGGHQFQVMYSALPALEARCRACARAVQHVVARVGQRGGPWACTGHRTWRSPIARCSSRRRRGIRASRRLLSAFRRPPRGGLLPLRQTDPHRRRRAAGAPARAWAPARDRSRGGSRRAHRRGHGSAHPGGSVAGDEWIGPRDRDARRCGVAALLCAARARLRSRARRSGPRKGQVLARVLRARRAPRYGRWGWTAGGDIRRISREGSGVAYATSRRGSAATRRRTRRIGATPRWCATRRSSGRPARPSTFPIPRALLASFRSLFRIWRTTCSASVAPAQRCAFMSVSPHSARTRNARRHPGRSGRGRGVSRSGAARADWAFPGRPAADTAAARQPDAIFGTCSPRCWWHRARLEVLSIWSPDLSAGVARALVRSPRRLAAGAAGGPHRARRGSIVSARGHTTARPCWRASRSTGSRLAAVAAGVLLGQRGVGGARAAPAGACCRRCSCNPRDCSLPKPRLRLPLVRAKAAFRWSTRRCWSSSTAALTLGCMSSRRAREYESAGESMRRSAPLPARRSRAVTGRYRGAPLLEFLKAPARRPTWSERSCTRTSWPRSWMTWAVATRLALLLPA